MVTGIFMSLLLNRAVQFNLLSFGAFDHGTQLVGGFLHRLLLENFLTDGAFQVDDLNAHQLSHLVGWSNAMIEAD